MSTLFHHREDAEDPDLQIYSRRISLRAPPLPNLVSVTFPATRLVTSFLIHLMLLQCPILTIPPGRAADWHQHIGTYETLPAPKCVAFRKDMPQPLWELRLNPDYGTLPGVPLLEALQGVGVLGAGVPPYSQRAVSMNIYVGGPPACLSRDVKIYGTFR